MRMKSYTTTLGLTKSPFQSAESLVEGSLMETATEVKPIQRVSSKREVDDVFLKSSRRQKPSIRTIDEGEF